MESFVYFFISRVLQMVILELTCFSELYKYNFLSLFWTVMLSFRLVPLTQPFLIIFWVTPKLFLFLEEQWCKKVFAACPAPFWGIPIVHLEITLLAALPRSSSVNGNFLVCATLRHFKKFSYIKKAVKLNQQNALSIKESDQQWGEKNTRKCFNLLVLLASYISAMGSHTRYKINVQMSLCPENNALEIKCFLTRNIQHTSV